MTANCIELSNSEVPNKPHYSVSIFPSRQRRIIEKQIVTQLIDVIILKITRDRSLSGYAVICFIKDKFNVRLSAGTVYYRIHILETKGFLKVTEKKGKYYDLTEKGNILLKVFLSAHDAIHMILNKL